MFGLLATIIAAVKGRSGFAWFTGIWTALAVIMSLSGGSKYAVGPGVLFFAIAIGMKKDRPSDSNAQNNSKNEPSVDGSKKYICTRCGGYSSGWYQTCPSCGAVGKMDKATPQIVSRISQASTEVTKSSYNGQQNTVSVYSCRKCGAQLQPGSEYCQRCGAVSAKKLHWMKRRIPLLDLIWMMCSQK